MIMAVTMLWDAVSVRKTSMTECSPWNRKSPMMLDNSPKDPTMTISLGLDTSDPISLRCNGYCVETYQAC